jgi:hypothetical protein
MTLDTIREDIKAIQVMEKQMKKELHIETDKFVDLYSNIHGLFA